MLFGIPWIEWVGYLASVLIAISLLMKDMFKLRIINAVGCLVFVFYGYTIKAYPVAFMNGLIVLIDLYYLNQLNKEQKIKEKLGKDDERKAS